MGSGASAPVQRVSSAEATRRNTEIDQQLLVDKQEEKITFKLLLLGGSESGKSTIAKQMRIIHLNGFGETDLINYRFLVHSNLVELFTQLISAATRLKAHMDDETKRLITAFNAFRKSARFGSHEINDQAKYVIDKLWASSAIQGVYERREEITSLPDNTDYLIERFDQICRSDYIPNQQDILYSRIATTGVHEIRFPFNNRFFRLIDVGGQKSERRKWIHCFENVTAILFIAALSSYDQQLSDDPEVNRMHDSLSLFKSSITNKYFVKSSVILFLNKKDIFAKKILRSPLNRCFQNYTGGSDIDKAANFIMHRFLEKNKQKSTATEKRHVYVHMTNATDTRNVDIVFAATADVVMKKTLGNVGVV